jgi:hypothetical protein
MCYLGIIVIIIIIIVVVYVVVVVVYMCEGEERDIDMFFWLVGS